MAVIPEAVTELRYLVEFAYVPDEATWCSETTLEALQAKLSYLWGITSPLLKFHLVIDGQSPKEIAIIDNEDFNTWLYRGDRDGAAMRPQSKRLFASDRSRSISVMHTSDTVLVKRRPLLDSVTLQESGATCALKHSTTEEVMLIGAQKDLYWSTAVQKVQQAWGVCRPVLRYVDEDDKGERVVISIVNGDDFSFFTKRRMTRAPELTVFEHAAPMLVEEYHKNWKIDLAIPIRAIPAHESVPLLNPSSTPGESPTKSAAAAPESTQSALTVPSVSPKVFAGLGNRSSLVALERELQSGDFGPGFTTPSKAPAPKREKTAAGEAHLRKLVQYMEKEDRQVGSAGAVEAAS